MRAVSSAGERRVDIAKASGSIPLPPTTLLRTVTIGPTSAASEGMSGSHCQQTATAARGGPRTIRSGGAVPGWNYSVRLPNTARGLLVIARPGDRAGTLAADAEQAGNRSAVEGRTHPKRACRAGCGAVALSALAGPRRWSDRRRRGGAEASSGAHPSHLAAITESAMARWRRRRRPQLADRKQPSGETPANQPEGRRRAQARQKPAELVVVVGSDEAKHQRGHQTEVKPRADPNLFHRLTPAGSANAGPALCCQPAPVADTSRGRIRRPLEGGRTISPVISFRVPLCLS
jgi:hypothetical protein